MSVMVASAKRSLSKTKIIEEVFEINNDSRDIKWLVILCIKKKLDDIDLNGIMDMFVS